MFFPATVSSRLFGPNRMGCLRKGGFGIDTDAGCATVAEVLQRLSPEACRARKVPEGASLRLPVVRDSACKTEGQAVRVCFGDRSPARRTEVPNIKMFEYALTKKVALALSPRADRQLGQEVFHINQVVVEKFF